MSDDDLTEIKVLTARIDERVGALSDSMAVQHKSLSDKIEGLAAKVSLDGVEDRVAKLEATQTWLVRGIVGTAMTALAAASGLTKKLGL